MALISITHLRVRSWRYLIPFTYGALMSARQDKRAPGVLGVSLLRDENNTFWTRTAWQDEASMKAFMLSGPHRRVMPKLVVHWTQDTAEHPDWKEAHRRMVQDGRRSKVNHPSPAHTAYEIPEPKA